MKGLQPESILKTSGRTRKNNQRTLSQTGRRIEEMIYLDMSKTEEINIKRIPRTFHEECCHPDHEERRKWIEEINDEWYSIKK